MFQTMSKILRGNNCSARTKLHCREKDCTFHSYSKFHLICHLNNEHNLLQVINIKSFIGGGIDLRSVFDETVASSASNGDLPQPAILSENWKQTKVNNKKRSGRHFSCENCCQVFNVGDAKTHFDRAIHVKSNQASHAHKAQ